MLFLSFFFINNCHKSLISAKKKFAKLLFDCFQLKHGWPKEGNNQVKFLSTCLIAKLVDL